MKPDDGTIDIYTDGACSGNPGPGGWGVLIVNDAETERIHGGEARTTNNRMELTAAIEALRRVDPKTPVRLWTDSQYVQLGITQWIANWKRKGWRTAGRAPVKNVDLWQALDALAAERDVEWRWLKGHAGHAGNEEADRLARLGIEQL